MRRHILAAAFACLGLTVPATAETPPPPYLHFDVGPGVGAKVTTYGYGADQRMEVVRQGQVVAQSTGTRGGRGTVMTPGLAAGDVASVYVNGTRRFSATFDGTPTLDGACVGRSSFTFTRAGLGHEWRAGVLTPADYPRDGSVPFGAERTDGPLTLAVALPRPLALGDYAYAATRARSQDGVTVLSSRIIVVDHCPAPPAVKPVARPALGDAARKLRTLRRTANRLTLPMTFTEPGTIRLRLTTPGGRTVADGKRARTVAGRANVTLEVTRRAALRRAKRVTLHATFTPARSGVQARRASTTLRLR
jgi:hypothetical protein